MLLRVLLTLVNELTVLPVESRILVLSILLLTTEEMLTDELLNGISMVLLTEEMLTDELLNGRSMVLLTEAVLTDELLNGRSVVLLTERVVVIISS